jgi:hypothetical protein
MITGLFLTLLALVGIIAIMVWIVQLPFVALLAIITSLAWVRAAHDLTGIVRSSLRLSDNDLCS